MVNEHRNRSERVDRHNAHQVRPKHHRRGWLFEESAGGVHVTMIESFAGNRVDANFAVMQSMLDTSLNSLARTPEGGCRVEGLRLYRKGGPERPALRHLPDVMRQSAGHSAAGVPEVSQIRLRCCW